MELTLGDSISPHPPGAKGSTRIFWQTTSDLIWEDPKLPSIIYCICMSYITPYNHCWRRKAFVNATLEQTTLKPLDGSILRKYVIHLKSFSLQTYHHCTVGLRWCSYVPAKRQKRVYNMRSTLFGSPYTSLNLIPSRRINLLRRLSHPKTSFKVWNKKKPKTKRVKIILGQQQMNSRCPEKNDFKSSGFALEPFSHPQLLFRNDPGWGDFYTRADIPQNAPVCIYEKKSS